jgi:hypothetical protein
MKQDWDAPEWLRDLRGFPAYHLHSLFHWLSFALLPYAGDWAYRTDRRAAKRRARDGGIGE